MVLYPVKMWAEIDSGDRYHTTFISLPTASPYDP